MKKIRQIITLSNLVKGVIGLVFIAFILLGAHGGDKKVTVCHTPPGNPSNHHLIKISVNAVAEHLNHGDKVMCYGIEELDDLFVIVGGDETKLVKVWELKDASSDAYCK